MRAPPPPLGVPVPAPVLTRGMFLVGSAAIIAFVFYCFWPLTHYFFSQDDFYFLEKASSGFRASMEPYFNARPGHFRPITKGLYFLMMWPLFGLNVIPYHVVSLVLHAVNSILMGTVLRRLGVSIAMSAVAAILFAANIANLEVVAWISCIQQLLGAMFAFTALVWGIDSLTTKSRLPVIGATIAYLLALGSYEQTLAVPLVLIVWAWSRYGRRAALRACRGPLLPMLLLLTVYCIYVLGIRGLPRAGPYEMWAGSNVLDNIRQYLGSVFAIWLLYPYVDLPLGLRGSHIVWGVLIAGFLLRRKPRQLAFGCIAFVLFLAPVLFIRHHVFSFHLYIPAIGAWYLLAGGADSLLEALAGAWPRRVRLAVACALMVAVVGSTLAVKKNLVNYCSDDVQIPQLRVLRRAVLAEQVCRDVARSWPGGHRLVLVYTGDPGAGNWGNIRSSMNDASALRLVLHQPELEVLFLVPEECAGIPPDEEMFVTELGNTFTAPQYEKIRARHPYQP